MSSTFQINQEVAERRHAGEQQQDEAGPIAVSNVQQNVGSSERTVSMTAGGVLAGLGLIRGGLSGLAMLGMGGALAFRGATGYCSVYHVLGVNTTETEHSTR